MTNELEKQFFDTFKLTKYKLISKYNKLLTYGPFDTLEDTKTVAKGLMDCFIIEEVYPQITDRILLELICIIARNGCCRLTMDYQDRHDLKQEVLKELIAFFDYPGYHIRRKTQVRKQIEQLFEEG